MGKQEKIIASSDAVAVTKRARRMKRIAKASTLTFTVELPVRRFLDAQAKAAGMNLTHYMQKMVETHVIDTAPQNDALAVRLSAKRAVIDRTVALAQKLFDAGKFDEHFILTVVTQAQKDKDFVSDYSAVLGGEDAADSRSAQRARVAINQQIGRMIKKAIGARSKRTQKGRIARAQVQDAMISTYTLLEMPVKS